MKKTALSIITLISFAAAMNAKDVVVKPTSDTRASINVSHDDSDTLIMNSSLFDKYGSGTVSNNPTYAAVRVINGESAGNASIAVGALTIDANSSVANYNALSADTWAMNYYTLTFRNTNASAASVNVNLNTLTLASTATGSVTQYQYINFKDTTYNLSATTVNLGNTGKNYKQNTSTFTVDSGATVNWTGSNFYVQQNGIININGTLTLTGQFTLAQEGATINVSDGATFNATETSAAKFTMNAGTTMNVGTNSTVYFTNGSTSYLNGTINTASAMAFRKINTSTGTFTQTAGGVTFYRPATMNSGANWTVYDKVTLMGGDTTEARTAALTINDGVTFKISGTKPRIIFQGHSDLVLNKSDAVLDPSGNPIALITYSDTSNNKMHVNADQTFDRLLVNNSDLSMYLGSGAVIRFDPETYASFSANTAYLKIFNFAEDSVYFKYTESVAATVNNYVKLYGDDTEGSFLGMGILGTDGWVTLTIPEPSTWAALLGAIVLGFAIYRRRK
jgi:hypothetical protein